MGDLLESTESGWRPDPSGRYEWRYWDAGWTNRVANSARAGDLPDAQAVPTATEPPPTAPAAAPAEAPPAPAATAEEPAATAAEPAATPTPQPSDPFAVLRAPRDPGTEPERPPVDPPSVAPPTATAPFAATPDASPAPPAARVEPTPIVPTHPTKHDGTTGTEWDAPYVPADDPSGTDPSASRRAPKTRGGILGAVTAFVRSFWEQEESYHSPHAGVQLPPHPKEQQLAPPPSYARAGLVMLAAAGVAIGAYLPWISGHVGGNRYELTGYQLHDAWGFTWVAAVFALAAVLGARRRVMGWVTMGMSVLVAGLVAKQLLDVHDMVTSLNTSLANDLDIGIGLWIMLAAAAIGLIAAFRLDTPTEIV